MSEQNKSDSGNSLTIKKTSKGGPKKNQNPTKKKPSKGRNQNNPTGNNKGSVTEGPLHLFQGWMNDISNNKLQQQFSNFLKILLSHLTHVEQYEWSKAMLNMTEPSDTQYSTPALDFSKYGNYKSYTLKNADGNEAKNKDTNKPIIKYVKTFNSGKLQILYEIELKVWEGRNNLVAKKNQKHRDYKMKLIQFIERQMSIQVRDLFCARQKYADAIKDQKPIAMLEQMQAAALETRVRREQFMGVLDALKRLINYQKKPNKFHFGTRRRNQDSHCWVTNPLR